MGTSKLAPSFLTSPGARLTVMRLCGSSYPEFRIAVAQRTLASTHAMSGRPTTTKPGSPRARSTWTSMGKALVPSSAAQRKEACTRGRIASGVPERRQSGGDGWRGDQAGTDAQHGTAGYRRRGTKSAPISATEAKKADRQLASWGPYAAIP